MSTSIRKAWREVQKDSIVHIIRTDGEYFFEGPDDRLDLDAGAEVRETYMRAFLDYDDAIRYSEVVSGMRHDEREYTIIRVTPAIVFTHLPDIQEASLDRYGLPCRFVLCDMPEWEAPTVIDTLYSTLEPSN